MSVRSWLSGKTLAFAQEADEVVETIMDASQIMEGDPSSTRTNLEIHIAMVYRNGYRIVPQEG